MFRSIQFRLVATYLVLALITVLLFGVLVQRLVTSHLITAAEDTLQAEGREIVRLMVSLDMAPGDRNSPETLVRLAAGITRATIIVADREGVVLAASREPARIIGQRFAAPLLQAAIQSGEAQKSTVRDPFNELSVVVAVPIRSLRQTTGALALFKPVAAVRSTAAPVRQFVIRGSLLAGGVAAFLGILLANTVSRPIRAATEAARKFAGGNLKHRLPVQGQDEIAELASTFNTMASRLDDMVHRLSTERAQMDAVLTNVVDPLFAVVGTGEVIFHNRAADQFFADVGSKHFRETISQPEVAGFVERALESLDQLTEPLALGDNAYYVATSSRFSEDNDGGVVVLLRDVSQERRLERLRQDFISNISHELRTPVTSIAGFLEALVDGLVDDRAQQQRYLGIITDETRRLNRLIDDLFDYGRMESGGMRYDFEPTDLNALLVDVRRQMKPITDGAGISLTLNIEQSMPAVTGDRDRLRQVLLNLITNAIQFTPKGGQITLSGGLTKHGSTVYVSVSDTGTGIAAEDLPQVFDRFHQAGRRQSGKAGGTGLGLAIARHIIDGHHGRIWAESEKGKGSRFTFELPVSNQ